MQVTTVFRLNNAITFHPDGKYSFEFRIEILHSFAICIITIHLVAYFYYVYK